MCLSGSPIQKSWHDVIMPGPSRIYNTLSILIRSRKKKLGCCSISFLLQPGRSPGMMLLCLNASRICNTLTILIRSRKKKLGCCSISYILCLSASRIYNKSLVQHFDPQPEKKIRQLFYILSVSPKQKSCHDVIMPEHF